MFFFSNKTSTGPTVVDFFLHAASRSPNLDKFVKVVRNVVSSSPLHSRGIGFEGKTCLVFVKRKLDDNAHKLDKGIYIINIPKKNCPFPSMHQSLYPLCIPFSVP